MGFFGLRQALRKVPPLFRAAQALQSTGRSVFGPAWLERQINRRLAAGQPLRIVVGSSYVYEEGWIPTNVQYLDLLNDAHWQRFFRNRPIDAILAEHVWEHLSLEDGRRAAAQCFKYLRPGGYVRAAVPDGNHPKPEYIEWVKIGGSGPGADDHKVLYTYDLFRDVLASAGFDVRLLEYYDENGEFHGVQFHQADGRIHRCMGRVEEPGKAKPFKYTSIILDAVKPAS